MPNIDADAAKLAGLLIDLLAKLRAGQLSLEQLERFLNLSLEAREERFGGSHINIERKRTPYVPPDPAVIMTPGVYLVERKTHLDIFLDDCLEFMKKFLGVKVDLREMFVIPEDLRLRFVIPVFDPGDLTNLDAIGILKAVKRTAEDPGLNVCEQIDVMKYSGSEANKQPTLCFIESSFRPDSNTMNFSPNQLMEMNRNWLTLRGYALAFALHYFVTGGFLDSHTFTWFPENCLDPNQVANACWDPDNHKITFGRDNAISMYDFGGARLAISVPLRS